MKFTTELVSGTLIRRYKRFLADVQLPDGTIVTVHCPNSGSMKGCAETGWEVRLSDHARADRKLRYTLEIVNNGVCWIGINTMVPNRIVAEALDENVISELAGFDEFRREVKYGDKSRLDFQLRYGDQLCYVEVKNVTLVDAAGIYRFPDAVTSRGTKHLHELMKIKESNHRAAMLYVIQRSDGMAFSVADDIDPVYAQTLRDAHAAGVEIIPYLADVSEDEIRLSTRVPFDLSA